MTLDEYRRTTGVTYAHIAKQCDVSTSAISQIACGGMPRFDLAVKIEKATHGLVGRENWFPPRPAEMSITIGTSV
jgi:hypothetical protein